MRKSTGQGIIVWLVASFAMLFLNLSAFAMESGGMMKGGSSGEMMQNEPMSADEMIKKGDEMIAEGNAMKKKGMMMKKEEMKKGGMKQGESMMKENEMGKSKMNEMKEMNK